MYIKYNCMYLNASKTGLTNFKIAEQFGATFSD